MGKPQGLTPFCFFRFVRFVLGAHFSDEEFDTVGGLIVSRFGHLPKRGESVKFDGFNFSILRADSRRLHAVRVTRVAPEDNAQLPLV